MKKNVPAKHTPKVAWTCLLLLISLLSMFSCVEDEGGAIPVFLDVITEVSNIDFEAAIIDQPVTQSYRVVGTKLTGDVAISTTPPFAVSRSASEGFGTSLSISPADLAAGPVVVFVQFFPVKEGKFAGEITHITEGLPFIPAVDLVGVGTQDPASLPVILFEEHFDYPGETILPSTDRLTSDGNQDLEGWLKVRAANKELVLASAGLDFSGYPVTGEGTAVIIDRNPDEPGGQTNLLQHNISAQQNSDFVGSFYTSFLFQAEDIPTTAGGFNSPLIYGSWNPVNGASWWASGFLVQNDKANDGDPDNMVFGLRYETHLEVSARAMEKGKTYLIVLKQEVTQAIPAEQEATITSVASLFVFEEGDAIDTENEPTPVIVMNDVPDKHYIRSVTLFQENSNEGRYIIDGIRVTNKWEDLFK